MQAGNCQTFLTPKIMPSRNINDLHPTLSAVYQQAEKTWQQRYPERPQPFLTCTFRNGKEQNELYYIGRTRPGKKVTNARAGESPHNYMPSFAFDIAFITVTKKLAWDEALFRDFAGIVAEISNEVFWGGNFTSLKDAPHFELKNWKQK